MKRDSVSSSTVAAIGYDPGSETLEVEFTNGSVYRYFNLSAGTYEQLMAAPSKGKFLHYYITNAYPYSRVGQVWLALGGRATGRTLRDRLEGVIRHAAMSGTWFGGRQPYGQAWRSEVAVVLNLTSPAVIGRTKDCRMSAGTALPVLRGVLSGMDETSVAFLCRNGYRRAGSNRILTRNGRECGRNWFTGSVPGSSEGPAWVWR